MPRRTLIIADKNCKMSSSQLKDLFNFDTFLRSIQKSIERKFPFYPKRVCTVHGVCFCERCVQEGEGFLNFYNTCEHQTEDCPAAKMSSKRINQLHLVLLYIKAQEAELSYEEKSL